MNTFSRIFQPHLLLCCCLLLLGHNSIAAEPNVLRISTDIAPTHSLVSLVVGELVPVELIVPSNQSPHDFTLKPSQIRSINQSNLIVIVSEGFSPSLSRHLKTIKPDTVVLNLADTRSASAHQENAEHTDSHLLHDEHTWLNPNNAIVWLEHIAEAVATLDESNRTKYQRNADNAIADIRQMYQALNDQLAGVRTVPYIVYHDAYQHFAEAFSLANPLAIALSDARAPGAAKLKQIRTAGLHSKCVFAEVQHDDAIVDTVSTGLGLKRGILDPLGSSIAIGPNLYSVLIQGLAQSFYDCLSD